MTRQFRSAECAAGKLLAPKSRLTELKTLILISWAVVVVAVTRPLAPNSQARAFSGSARQEPAASQAAARGSDRFDSNVRELFFSGFVGDAAALDEGMKICEEALAKDSHNAAAMVWHGSGLAFRGGQAFRKGDVQKGLDLWQRGLKEMDDAVRLQPANVQVLIPRGATLLTGSRYEPRADEARRLLQKGVGDYEAVLKIQAASFGQLSMHSRGELLFGLAEGWYRLGDQAKARSYFDRLVAEAAGSGRDSQAAEFLKTGALPKNLFCVGCHR